jgi:hypothetical protein
MRHAPGSCIIVIAVPNVKYFAKAFGTIAVVFEVLWQRYGIGRRPAEVGAQVVNPKRLRSQSSQKGIARRRANRLIAIGPIESHSARGQPIDIWRSNDLVAIAAEQRLQVIDAD